MGGTYDELPLAVQTLDLVYSVPHTVQHVVEAFLLDDLPRRLQHQH